MTDSEVKSTLTEFFALALTIWGEARSEPVEGRIFVGCVVRNRVQTGYRFGGKAYDKVCLKRAQFSCWWPDGGPENYGAVMARARMLVDREHSEPRTLMDAALKECLFVAEGIIGGQLEDRSCGSNHYLTHLLWTSRPPAWAAGKKPAVEVGAHVGFVL